MPVLDDWVKVSEATEILRVSKARVHQLIDKYNIETLPFHRRLTLLNRKDVERVAKMERPSGIHIDQRKQVRRRRRGA